MNETIKQLQDRRSVREFTGENIKEKDLQAILYTAQRAANSVNGQQTSLIVIRDKQKLEKLLNYVVDRSILQKQAFLYL